MRLLLCCIILIIIGRNAMMCYICHVYSQDLNKLRKEGDSVPKSVLLVRVMCSRNPTYCGPNLCCCASTSCYDELRNHFLQGLLRSKKDIICDVYRQQWIGNRRKRLNISLYPTSEQLYRRIACDACASRVDEKGVEMICIEKDIEIACRGMNVFVGDDIACNGNGNCCCQREDCSKALRNFYSNHQKMLGTPRVFVASSSGYCLNPSSLIVAISISIIVF